VVLPGAGSVTSSRPEAFLDLSVKTGALVPTERGMGLRSVINGSCDRGSWVGIAVQVLVGNPKPQSEVVRSFSELKPEFLHPKSEKTQ
jgi:hypothetical protein